MENRQVLDVTDDVKWIGVLDRDLVTFDIVMETRYGTTYNSYFINADKKAVIETTKEVFKEEYLDKINQVTNPSEIEYIILNHTEPDHSGNLKHLLKIAPEATVVGSGQALNYLKEMVGEPFKMLKVKDGDTLDLGNKTLRFIGAPNLHWPDSIYTYLEEEKLLFTCDSFGAHFCDDRIFDDLASEYTDSFKYYFDVILKPFSKFMLKAIEKIRPLDIKMICPGHGPVLRSTWKEKVDLSEKYAREYLESIEHSRQNILITYVSAYGYTKEMAFQIAEGIKAATEVNIDVVDIENILPGDLEEKIVKAHAILIGSPTINQNTLLPIYKMFALINPLRDKGKPAAAFGSYGWSGEAVKLIETQLIGLKLNVVGDGMSLKFYPNNGKADELKNFGKEFASHLAS
ncbi:MAG TPA: FprA family A-type flavoprotein [Bacteroidales bacterium]|nr:FprA family A-type flavoprotein [Bacteroidales bacterium]